MLQGTVVKKQNVAFGLLFLIEPIIHDKMLNSYFFIYGLHWYLICSIVVWSRSFTMYQWWQEQDIKK